MSDIELADEVIDAEFIDEVDTAPQLTDAQRWLEVVVRAAMRDPDLAEGVRIHGNCVFAKDKEQARHYMRVLRQAGFASTIRKDFSDQNARFELTVSGLASHLMFTVFVNREQVCVAKKVGTETVEVRDYANCPTKTVTRDVVEWECTPLLAEE